MNSIFKKMEVHTTRSGVRVAEYQMPNLDCKITLREEKNGRFVLKCIGYSFKRINHICSRSKKEISPIVQELYNELEKIDVLKKETSMTPSQEKEAVKKICNTFRSNYADKAMLNKSKRFKKTKTSKQRTLTTTKPTPGKVVTPTESILPKLTPEPKMELTPLEIKESKEDKQQLILKAWEMTLSAITEL